jgi:hypothetical protein
MIIINTNYSSWLLINHKIDLNFIYWVANSKIKKGGWTHPSNLTGWVHPTSIQYILFYSPSHPIRTRTGSSSQPAGSFISPRHCISHASHSLPRLLTVTSAENHRFLETEHLNGHKCSLLSMIIISVIKYKWKLFIFPYQLRWMSELIGA